MSARKPYLALYDYAAAGRWAFVVAESREYVEDKFPALQVFDDPPAWMSEDELARIRREATFNAEEPTSWLAQLVDHSSDPLRKALRKSHQRAWPQRYAVRIYGHNGEHERTYTVTTWMHERKAMLLAIDEHIRQHGPGRSASAYDIAVTDLGPAPRTPDTGCASWERNDLQDRLEW